MRFAFFQVNTPQVTWKLARIPAEKLSAVTARVKEFEKDARDPVTGKVVIDPRTGFAKEFQTELLVDAFQLPVASSGTFEATSNDTETRRDVRCHRRSLGKGGVPSANEAFAGPYLFEASATLPDGRIVGNRSIICVNDYLLTQKRTPTTVIMRLAKMSDASSVAGVTIRAVTEDNIELARAVTDKNGIAEFPKDKVFPKTSDSNAKDTHLFIADTATGPALQFAEATAFPSGVDSAPSPNRPHAEIVTDRNLYRPGHTVKMKGLARDVTDFSGLMIPVGAAVHWSISESDGSRVVGEGDTTLSAYGGWEAEWNVPEKAKLGSYEVRCAVGGRDYAGVTVISVQEYRVPLFSVMVEATTPEVGTTAHARISSAYFHGAPNAGARVHWKASWTTSADFASDSEGPYRKRFNSYAEVGPRLDVDSEDIKTIEGDTQLDAHGFATIACESPFKDNPAVGRTNIIWRADVTSIDGQTLSGGEMATLFATETRLGVRAEEQVTEPAGVKVDIDALNPEDQKQDGVLVRADLFHVTTKTVKEQIAPFVYRYRNTDQFAKVASQESKTPAELIFPTTETGRYVVAVNATKVKAPVVSDETTVTGEEAAQLPVVNETTFKIDRRAEPFLPGEKAAFTIQAPFGGVAWVSVETDEVLDTLLVPVKGNAGRIEVPIKENYAPNATVSIYLVKPGGENELPLERFAYSEIDVRRPDRELKVAPHLANTTAKPGDVVRGEVLVTSQDKPVADADLLVFAVDDAVLTLGDWKLPNIGARFYPRNVFSVRTYEALHGYIENLAKLSLTQKGFVIGDGGEEMISNVKNVRKEFRTLAFWQGSLKTGADGKSEIRIRRAG